MRYDNRNNNKPLIGAIIIAIGIVLFLQIARIIFLPQWLFTWPMIPILVGLLTLISKGPAHGGWIAPVLVGVCFLVVQNFPQYDLQKFIAPFILVIIGVSFIFRPKNRDFRRADRFAHRRREYFEKSNPWRANPFEPRPMADDATEPAPQPFTPEGNTDQEYINITAVFGGNRKTVYSKNFAGGEIVCVMGGADIDLSNADIQGPVQMEITCFMGGAKIIVPPHWRIVSEATVFMGGVDDKRNAPEQNTDAQKVLTIDGTCIMGGIEIKSY